MIELPLGPEWDAAATYRSIWSRRPVANGVSGYDPPHYAPLMDALEARDPAILVAMGSLGRSTWWSMAPRIRAARWRRT